MKANLLCCLLCFCFCGVCVADDYFSISPYQAYGWGCCYCPTSYSQESVPYFALHPPVYYSYPIARTYGDSPYPYPPGLNAMQAQTPSAQPQIIRNDYIDESQESDQQVHNRVPLRIRNPFIEPTDTTDSAKGVEWEAATARKPLIVYPASVVQQRK
jgi:hypothetical protein